MQFHWTWLCYRHSQKWSGDDDVNYGDRSSEDDDHLYYNILTIYDYWDIWISWPLTVLKNFFHVFRGKIDEARERNARQQALQSFDSFLFKRKRCKKMLEEFLRHQFSIAWNFDFKMLFLFTYFSVRHFHSAAFDLFHLFSFDCRISVYGWKCDLFMGWFIFAQHSRFVLSLLLGLLSAFISNATQHDKRKEGENKTNENDSIKSHQFVRRKDFV